MHLGATVRRWRLIARIFLKPKTVREAKARKAKAEENYCTSIQTSIRINCGGSFFKFSIVSPKVSPECFIQGSCRNNLRIKVLTWIQLKMLSHYFE